MTVGQPRGGRCCSCGYDGAEETPCSARDDGHCDHWWDGVGDGAERCKCGRVRDEHGGPHGEGACEASGCEAFSPPTCAHVWQPVIGSQGAREFCARCGTGRSAAPAECPRCHHPDHAGKTCWVFTKYGQHQGGEVQGRNCLCMGSPVLPEERGTEEAIRAARLRRLTGAAESWVAMSAGATASKWGPEGLRALEMCGKSVLYVLDGRADDRDLPAPSEPASPEAPATGGCQHCHAGARVQCEEHEGPHPLIPGACVGAVFDTEGA